jgi:hypothetical protein
MVTLEAGEGVACCARSGFLHIAGGVAMVTGFLLAHHFSVLWLESA